MNTNKKIRVSFKANRMLGRKIKTYYLFLQEGLSVSNDVFSRPNVNKIRRLGDRVA